MTDNLLTMTLIAFPWLVAVAMYFVGRAPEHKAAFLRGSEGRIFEGRAAL